ncbi:hypothetical protein IscW_ISCW009487 [Ixodes scapularis]|uniref:Uncharacterized protein n=1 Tax=Ixodes scapularis TaxID=6945 RepID=B7PYX4_IXOSC|nr:hypothetical protein IscW_ISCW009487 [Ixodes scapularis]|eukprot:XP_002404230.1 hypothetical protein IscW_ISCW009487 [Ixodes scapularis]
MTSVPGQEDHASRCKRCSHEDRSARRCAMPEFKLSDGSYKGASLSASQIGIYVPCSSGRDHAI